MSMHKPEPIELYMTSHTWARNVISFPEVDSHASMHFLAFLLASFKVVNITGKCFCSLPIQEIVGMKSPTGRSGSSDGSAQ
jgi:hypothetical protein